MATFPKYENIDKLTRKILIELLDVNKAYEGGAIAFLFYHIEFYLYDDNAFQSMMYNSAVVVYYFGMLVITALL